MKFEFLKKSNPVLKKEELKKDNKTVLSHLRNSGLNNKLIKSGTVATLFLGVENGIKAENNNDLKDIKIENINTSKIENDNPSPESYDASLLIKGVEGRLDNKDSSSVLISSGIKKSNKEYSEFIINYASEKQTKILEEIHSLKNKINKVDSTKDYSLYSKISEELKDNQDNLDKWNNFKKQKEAKLNEVKESPEFKFSKDDEIVIKNSEAIVNSFEIAKKQIIDILSTSNYLKKLSIEFNCNLKETRCLFTF